MCVIFANMVERPTPEMVTKAWDRNKHGGGVAWREKDEATGKMMVHWAKDLTLKEMEEACATLPIPFIAHFRVASVGGIRGELCHPFEISAKTPNTTEGVTENRVLFHNGDWGEWRKILLKGAFSKGIELPDGKWSDSRAMAFLAALYGKNIMDVIDQKGVAFGPGTGDTENVWDDIEFFTGGSDWKEINKVWCSNDLFWGGVRIGGMCRDANCSVREGLDSSGRCSKHRKDLPVDPTVLPNDEVSDEEVCQALVKMDEKDARDSQKKKNRAGFGGNQQPTPFPVEVQALIDGGFKDQALRTAERMRLNHPEKLSKNGLKRIRVFLTGTAMTPQFQDDHLKDPRFEVVTHSKTVH